MVLQEVGVTSMAKAKPCSAMQTAAYINPEKT
jgi:hypothetical protein